MFQPLIDQFNNLIELLYQVYIAIYNLVKAVFRFLYKQSLQLLALLTNLWTYIVVLVYILISAVYQWWYYGVFLSTAIFKLQYHTVLGLILTVVYKVSYLLTYIVLTPFLYLSELFGCGVWFRENLLHISKGVSGLVYDVADLSKIDNMSVKVGKGLNSAKDKGIQVTNTLIDGGKNVVNTVVEKVKDNAPVVKEKVKDAYVYTKDTALPALRDGAVAGGNIVSSIWSDLSAAGKWTYTKLSNLKAKFGSK